MCCEYFKDLIYLLKSNLLSYLKESSYSSFAVKKNYAFTFFKN